MVITGDTAIHGTDDTADFGPIHFERCAAELDEDSMSPPCQALQTSKESAREVLWGVPWDDVVLVGVFGALSSKMTVLDIAHTLDRRLFFELLLRFVCFVLSV